MFAQRGFGALARFLGLRQLRAQFGHRGGVFGGLRFEFAAQPRQVGSALSQLMFESGGALADRRRFLVFLGELAAKFLDALLKMC